MTDEPRYNKPEQPGIWMGFDNTVDIYHIVGSDDTFVQAAQDIFALLKQANEQFPDWPRILYVDIIGHRKDNGHFEDDFIELQQEFLIGFMGGFFTAIDMPLVSVYNPDEQRNDVPERLNIDPPRQDPSGNATG
jgi:hypothetical protein